MALLESPLGLRLLVMLNICVSTPLKSSNVDNDILKHTAIRALDRKSQGGVRRHTSDSDSLKQKMQS